MLPRYRNVPVIPQKKGMRNRRFVLVAVSLSFIIAFFFFRTLLYWDDHDKDTSLAHPAEQPVPTQASTAARVSSVTVPNIVQKPEQPQPSQPAAGAAAPVSPSSTVCVGSVCAPAFPAGRKPAALQLGDDAESVVRREKIRQSVAHAWSGYVQHAFGHDEIRPVTNATNDSWGGFGAVLVDAMDTLHLVGLHDEYRQAKAHAVGLNFEKDYDASLFETSIRYIGGLLGAQALTGDAELAEVAVRLGNRLLPAFNTTTGIPHCIVNLKTGATRNPKWTQGASILAEAGSVQLEFATLSRVSSQPSFDDRSRRGVVAIADAALKRKDALFPVFVNPSNGAFTTDQISFGGLGDSFYEILLKTWVLTGREFERSLYISAMRDMRSRLVQRTEAGHVYVAEWKGGRPVGRMDHLVCYVPGMLALGHMSGAHLAEEQDELLQLAEELVDTCVQLYESTPTGFGPETVRFDKQGVSSIESARYLLRPETLESLFYLYRATGKPKFREAGWRVYEAIEKLCRTPAAYSGIQDVTKATPVHDNSMQSFFLAETMKYLYLLFSPSDVIPLDQFVFTTEAHPLLIADRRNAM